MKYFIIYVFVLLMIFSSYLLSVETLENFIVNPPIGAGKLMTTPFSQSFKIENRMFGWKEWWRNNMNNSSVSEDESFKGTAYETYSKNTPLLYDGVREISPLCSYLP
jgi:hypothetical protein